MKLGRNGVAALMFALGLLPGASALGSVSIQLARQLEPDGVLEFSLTCNGHAPFCEAMKVSPLDGVEYKRVSWSKVSALLEGFSRSPTMKLAPRKAGPETTRFSWRVAFDREIREGNSPERDLEILERRLAAILKWKTPSELAVGVEKVSRFYRSDLDPQTSFSQDAPLPRSRSEEFCADPVSAICKRAGRRVVDRRARVAAFERNAKARAARRGGDGTLDKVMLGMVAPLEYNAIDGNSDLAKDLMIKVIRDSVSDESVMESFVENIQAAKFMSSWRLFMFPPSWQTDHDDLMSIYKKYCGEFGMTDNAFAWYNEDIWERRAYVFFCPGAVVSAYGGGHDAQHNTWSSLVLMGHELGHLISPNEFPDFYAKYFSCVAGNYGGLLDPTPQMTNVYDVLRLPPKSKLVNLLVTRSHLSEIVSDFWAAKVVGEYLKRNAAAFTQSEKLDVLVDAYGMFCDISRDDEPYLDGAHPKSKVRVGVVLRSDPVIQKIFGCERPDSGGRPACTLSGEAREFGF